MFYSWDQSKSGQAGPGAPDLSSLTVTHSSDTGRSSGGSQQPYRRLPFKCPHSQNHSKELSFILSNIKFPKQAIIVFSKFYPNYVQSTKFFDCALKKSFLLKMYKKDAIKTLYYSHLSKKYGLKRTSIYFKIIIGW